MQPCFDPAAAKKYGIKEAILLYDLEYQTSFAKLKENLDQSDAMFWDNRLWVRNSISSWLQVAIWFTQEEIEEAIISLQKQGAILIAVCEGDSDDTVWSSVTKEAVATLSTKPKN